MPKNTKDLYEDVIMNNFSENLKKILAENKFTNKELANDICVTANMVGNWVNGKSLPTLSNLCRMIDFFYEKGVKNPMLQLFPYLLGRELIDLKKKYEQIAEDLKLLLNKQDQEKYDELDSDYNQLQEEYDKLKKEKKALEKEIQSLNEKYSGL